MSVGAPSPDESGLTLLPTLRDTLNLAGEWLRLEVGSSAFAGAASRGARRHLALFAWALPPNSNAGVHRPLSFIRYGTRLSWRIDAFHGEAPNDQREHGDELLARVPPEARLHLVPAPTRRPSYRFFPRIDGGFNEAIAHATHAIRQLAADPPDVVLASGPPFFAFVAALFVARHFGVPLVLDYRDEWTECPFDFVDAGGHDLYWERRCLAAADAVLFTTASHLKHQLATFPELRPDKAYVVPNGWEPDDFGELADAQHRAAFTDSGALRLAHVGNLAGHTPPHEFLASLQQLLTAEPEWRLRLRVQLIGRRSPSADEAIRKFGFPTNLEVIDHVGKREANRRMQESDALLLLATPELARYLPGKLFDYVAARRPVLVFGSAGEASTLLEQLGAGVLCASGSWVALGEALRQLRQLDMTGHDNVVRAWLQQHRRDELAMRAFTIIDSLIVRR